jgi:hypothetical protein
MPNETRSPELAELLDLAIERGLLRVNTWLPGRIDSYDATKQTATVVPELTLRAPAQDGSEGAINPPKLVDVPVVFPGANGFRITFPVAAGDRVMLMFAQRSLDEWKTTAGLQDPADERHHSLSDAVAMVGLHDFVSVWTGVPSDRLTLGKDGGAQVAVGPALVELGYPSASQKALLGDLFLADFTTLIAAIASAVGGAGSPAGATAAAAAINAALATFNATIHVSSTVKLSP